MIYKRPKLVPQTVKKASACRAVYHSEDVQRIEMRIDCSDGQSYLFDMSPHIAHQIASNILISYEAIFPPNVTRNWGGRF